MASVLGDAILFLNHLGIYDVILPFLLVFTIVFAILERTKIFGLENNKTKKNLNSMVAFVMAFFVIASAQLVEAITTISSHVVLLLMLSVLFMMLVGSFSDPKEVFRLEGGWHSGFVWIMFIGIVGIFLNAIKNEEGQSWLEYALNFVQQYYTDSAFATLLLLIFLFGAIRWIVNDGKPAAATTPKKD
ncbi:MAG: hypothetical protein Q7K43_03355 [Candidatus Woesearchaeota archaeon]|nr:hypothetical protein [Candidatus Woesearchaeota archaeon]